ncbi:testis-expressed protein 36 [Hyperolius riggenbachi]|uniref:testis-expressed protein 36 n=1 Tax=Hyperolius riggenbachi TaxID=752182 RepID=UPI0035A3260B
MPKRHLCNPPTARDGTWFPHIEVNMRLPRTSTQDMLQHAKSASWKEHRLPLICAANKAETPNGFPFSSHDNRHTIEWAGEYLDSGLGRRKTPHDKRQHADGNCSFSSHAAPLRASSYWDGFSNYQASYRGRQDTETPFCRRYPKHHPERSAHVRDVPENRFMWFGDYRGRS